MKGLHRSFQRVEDEQIARLDLKRSIERRLDAANMQHVPDALHAKNHVIQRGAAIALNRIGIPV